METLMQFHDRVDGFTCDSLPRSGPLTTRQPLTEKVSPDGRMLPFFGNTMIFDLPPVTRLAIARMQVLLHHRCGPMLAEPLHPHTLHMTLHDLLNGTDENALLDGLQTTEKAARAVLRRQRESALPGVHLTSTRAFNMVNGSVALGFAPDTEADCAALMAMHGDYQAVVPLSYPLTPHVTLAYYRPGVYGGDQVAALADVLAQIAQMPPVHLILTADDLHYYRFTDMNTYLRT